MGSVFYAHEVELNRDVAIKILHQGLLSDEEQRSRFEREGRILSTLAHPNILKFYRFGLWQDTYPFIVMEFLEGRSLREELDSNGRLSISRSVSLALKLCSAMQNAHDSGIIHRDLKPNNILLQRVSDDENPKVVDFGLARAIEGEHENQHLTQTGMLVGSVYYMSPEQCRGKKADKRSDIYSLACVIYESLTGLPPLTSENPIALLHKHATESPIPTAIRLGNEVPDQIRQLKQLDAILFRALAKEPDERYQTMNDFAADLQLFSSGKGSEITDGFVPVKPRTSHLIPWSITSLVLVVLIALCVIHARTPTQSISLKNAKSNARQARGLHAQIEALKRMSDGPEKLQQAMLIAKTVESAEQPITDSAVANVYGYLVGKFSHSGDYDALYDTLSRAVQTIRRHPAEKISLARLLYFSADCATKIDRYPQAYRDINECIELLNATAATSQDRNLSAIVLSRCYRHAKQFAKAEKTISDAIANNNSLPITQEQLYTELGLIFLTRNKLSEEDRVFHKALSLSKEGDIVCLMTMLSEWPPNYGRTGHKDLIPKRVATLVQVLESRPDAPLQEVYCAAGYNCLLENADLELSEHYFRLAAAQPQKNASVTTGIHTGLSRTLLRQGKIVEAHHAISQALQHFEISEQDEFLYLISDCVASDDLEDVDKIVHRSLVVARKANPPPSAKQIWPWYYAVWRRLPPKHSSTDGIAYLQNGLNLMRSCAAAETDIALAQQDLSKVLILNHRYSEAKTLLESAVPILKREKLPEQNAAYNDLARCCLALHAVSAADHWINEGLEYAKRHNLPQVSTLHQAANVYNTAGYPEKAGELYKQAYNQKHNPHTTAVAALVLSSFYLQHWRLSEAEPIARTALSTARSLAKRDPKLVMDLCFVLGTIHFNQGNPSQAYLEFEEASKLSLAHPALADEIRPLILMFDSLNVQKQTPKILKQQRQIIATANKFLATEKRPEIRHMLRLRQAILTIKNGRTAAGLGALDALCAAYDADPKPDDHVALVYETAASSHYSAKQYEKAILLQKKAVDIRRKRWGANEHDTVAAERVLAIYQNHR